jgi:hypothetical protein
VWWKGSLLGSRVRPTAVKPMLWPEVHEERVGEAEPKLGWEVSLTGRAAGCLGGVGASRVRREGSREGVGQVLWSL